MTLRNAGLIVGLSVAGALLTAGLALGQNEGPLYLLRPGEDPLLIDVTEMTQQYPKPAVREYQKAVDDARRGKRANAVTHLEEAIRMAPEFFSAHNSLGILYQKMARYRDAEREYKEAHRLNPRSAAPLVNLGSLHIEESGAPGAGDGLARIQAWENVVSQLDAYLEENRFASNRPWVKEARAEAAEKLRDLRQ